MSLRTSTLITALLLGLVLNAGTIVQIQADDTLAGGSNVGLAS